MSRIGNLPIALPAKVDVTIAGDEITVKGPLGSLSRRVAAGHHAGGQPDHPAYEPAFG